jgi:transposase InsO family protein
LNRQFQTEHPNRSYVTDITYLPIIIASIIYLLFKICSTTKS